MPKVQIVGGSPELAKALENLINGVRQKSNGKQETPENAARAKAFAVYAPTFEIGQQVKLNEWGRMNYSALAEKDNDNPSSFFVSGLIEGILLDDDDLVNMEICWFCSSHGHIHRAMVDRRFFEPA